MYEANAPFVRMLRKTRDVDEFEVDEIKRRESVEVDFSRPF